MDLGCTDTTFPSAYTLCLNLEIGQAATYYSAHLLYPIHPNFEFPIKKSIYFFSFKSYLQIYFNSCDPVTDEHTIFYVKMDHELSDIMQI